MASWLAVSTVKLPLIWPEPPRIGSRITGAEITLSSSTMANGRPTWSLVKLAELAGAGVVEAEGDDRLVGAAGRRPAARRPARRRARPASRAAAGRPPPCRRDS